MAGWVNLKLSKINIDLTASNNLISLKKLQENIATNYFNIVNLEKQIWNTRLNLNASDTLFSIVQNKYEEGLVKQQDVNEAKVIVIELEESISQLEQLKEQYYISLKLLCDIPEETKIEIKHESTPPAQDQSMMVQLNNLELKNALLKEQYLLKDIETAKTSFYPTLSLQLSNSFNLYNQDFKPFSGNWINNNYIGLRLNVPIPNAQTVAKKHNADFEYKLAVNNTQQAKEQAYLNRKNLEVEYNNTASLKQSKVEILALRRENYFKNKNLYEEGLISLDDTIKSFKEMINAEYNLVSQEVNTELIASKITINNNIR